MKAISHIVSVSNSGQLVAETIAFSSFLFEFLPFLTYT